MRGRFVAALALGAVLGCASPRPRTEAPARGTGAPPPPDVPVVPGATYPLLNSQEATKRWEGLYGRLVFKGPWTDYWPGDTKQSHPGAPQMQAAAPRVNQPSFWCAR